MEQEQKRNPLIGRTMYIPRMSFSGAKLMGAAFQSAGVNAIPAPPSDARTLELGGKYLTGDECLPERITLGNFLKVIEDSDFDSKKTAFLLPTAGGPCRFGQYQALFKKILKDKGLLNQVLVISPTSSNGYEGFGISGSALLRNSWLAILAGDIIRKLHLRVRPYALNKKLANELFHRSLEEAAAVLSDPHFKHKTRRQKLRSVLIGIRDRYRALPADYSQKKPLIGIVGEIYCRLNEYSNEYLVNKIEEFGGEVWMNDISEWAWYTTDEQIQRLKYQKKVFSKEMLAAQIKSFLLKKDEHSLLAPFKDDFRGYEEPRHVREVLNYSSPYLPQRGALGEMVLNVGKSIYLYHKGADGIVDISPFTCMNGIVCQTVYPQVSRQHDNFPIRIFYFDGGQTDLDRDVGIFMELARNYMGKKKKKRTFPPCFG
ncbi:MAG: hypothetical protein GXO74_12395 [Calditrichaeota bacterium]|nr:hypothetical protein [Calditrichota bacterium]